ncbi:MAG: hypothetical protein EBR30_13970 [Cytophagia bacterium]|nr:hypothetical protein [Cytophagia bacterium]NBW36096.1 hypothetical protein [Cytophagia bacterium]
MKKYICTYIFLLFVLLVEAQEKVDKKLTVYIDCASTSCDLNYIRSEINIIDFLLDRKAADIHILITSVPIGSGGNQYKLIFYGQNSHRTEPDTLSFLVKPVSTEFERRDLLVNHLKMGLAPWVAKTSLANKVIINMKSENSTESLKDITETKDHWNYWVFRAGIEGSVNLDQVYKSSDFTSYFNVNRATDKSKVQFNVYGGRVKSSFDYETDLGQLKVIVKNKNYGFDHLYVKSINNHWSYGYQIFYENNTFKNFKSRYFIIPQIEYSIFPYADINTKFITLRYGAGRLRNVYYDTTIFDKTNEILWFHNAQLNMSFNQKWGTIQTGFSYRNFFHNWKFNNLSLYSEIDVRITGGLSVYTYLSGSLVRDQINLASGGVSEEEVLSKRRQLQSSYDFFGYIGINYRFGSKLNNFVNPRFTTFK